MEEVSTDKITLHHGDSSEVIKTIPDESIDSCVTDPPYALTSILKRFGSPTAAPVNNQDTKTGRRGPFHRTSHGFMGKKWDTGDVAFTPEFWTEIYRVLKPGSHLIAFGGTRTYHRLACAIEDAGFEIRDQIGWLYGSGFPKSHDVAKGLDKKLGAAREQISVPAAEVRNPKATGGGRDGLEGATRPWIEAALERGYHEKDGPIPATPEPQAWQGWGTGLKPAWEPIVLARKALIGTVAENILEHGTGALNIDASRVGLSDSDDPRLGGEGTWSSAKMAKNIYEGGYAGVRVGSSPLGRWPANVIHDGSSEVLTSFPDGQSTSGKPREGKNGDGWGMTHTGAEYDDLGSAARFFYSAKADAGDRLESKHPTVKPVDLMAYLCRMITPPGGIVLDPFAGSGTTGMAAMREGFHAVLIEREAEYIADIKRRIGHVSGADTPLFSNQADMFK